MSSRPLTPPCVPFGTRRFNRISAVCGIARSAPPLSFPSPGLALGAFAYSSRSTLSLCTKPFRYFAVTAPVLLPVCTRDLRLFGPSRFFFTSGTMTSADFLRQALLRRFGFFSPTSASVRPPRVRAITFLPYICRIYNAKFGQYWTLSWLADSSALRCLLCDFCSSDREFARGGTSQPPHPASFRFHLAMNTLAFA